MPLSSQCVRTNSDAHSHLGVFMFVVCWSKTVCFFLLLSWLQLWRFYGRKRLQFNETCEHESLGYEWPLLYSQKSISYWRSLKREHSHLTLLNWLKIESLISTDICFIMICRNTEIQKWHNRVCWKRILTSREEIPALKNTCPLVSKMLPKDLLTEIKSCKHPDLLKWFGFNV